MKGALESGFVEVVTMQQTRLWVAVVSRCREDPLPRPFAWRVREFARQAVGQLNVACACLEVATMKHFDVAKMLAQWQADVPREQRDAVPSSFAVAHLDVGRRKVDVFHSEARALEQTQA